MAAEAAAAAAKARVVGPGGKTTAIAMASESTCTHGVEKAGLPDGRDEPSLWCTVWRGPRCTGAARMGTGAVGRLCGGWQQACACFHAAALTPIRAVRSHAVRPHVYVPSAGLNLHLHLHLPANAYLHLHLPAYCTCLHLHISACLPAGDPECGGQHQRRQVHLPVHPQQAPAARRRVHGAEGGGVGCWIFQSSQTNEAKSGGDCAVVRCACDGTWGVSTARPVDLAADRQPGSRMLSGSVTVCWKRLMCCSPH